MSSVATGVIPSALTKPDAPAHKAASAKDPQARDPKLWETCLKFESLLLQQMMSAMRKTVPKSELLPSGFADDMYNSMFDNVVAEAGSQRSNLGIANSMYRQLEQLHQTKAQAPAADKSIDMHDLLRGVKYGAN
jgi:Rod binding domain-containing protein